MSGAQFCAVSSALASARLASSPPLRSSAMSGQPLRVAVLGAGTVGREVVRAILERPDELTVDNRPALALAGIAVRDVEGAVARGLPAALLTDAPAHLLASGDAN